MAHVFGHTSAYGHLINKWFPSAPVADPNAATPDATQQVGTTTPNQTSYANLGRAALITTSPSGVQGLDPTGRRKLLGND